MFISYGSLHWLRKTIVNAIDTYVIVADRSTDVSETLLDRCIFFTGVTDDCPSSSFFFDEKNVATVLAKPLFFLIVFSSTTF